MNHTEQCERLNAEYEKTKKNWHEQSVNEWVLSMLPLKHTRTEDGVIYTQRIPKDDSEFEKFFSGFEYEFNIYTNTDQLLQAVDACGFTRFYEWLGYLNPDPEYTESKQALIQFVEACHKEVSDE